MLSLSRRGLLAGALSVPLLPVCEPRYLGYRAADRARPYAPFFTGTTLPPQPQVTAALAAGPVPTSSVPRLDAWTRDLRPAGRSAAETGWGTSPDGYVWAACRTRMPGVTAAMWDWWFGWHSVESARYKLWHPQAHGFCALAEDRTTARGLSDRQRYVGNVSYVDEWIGDQLQQLAIAFHDPVAAGFEVPAGHTVVLGRVGSSIAPLDLGWLAHQVRPVSGGVEMRSRFYLNVPGVRSVDAGQAFCAVARGVGDTVTQPLPFPVTFARKLLRHCGEEMNHLASFLPRLHARFSA